MHYLIKSSQELHQELTIIPVLLLRTLIPREVKSFSFRPGGKCRREVWSPVHPMGRKPIFLINSEPSQPLSKKMELWLYWEVYFIAVILIYSSVIFSNSYFSWTLLLSISFCLNQINNTAVGHVLVLPARGDLTDFLKNVLTCHVCLGKVLLQRGGLPSCNCRTCYPWRCLSDWSVSVQRAWVKWRLIKPVIMCKYYICT